MTQLLRGLARDGFTLWLPLLALFLVASSNSTMLEAGTWPGFTAAVQYLRSCSPEGSGDLFAQALALLSLFALATLTYVHLRPIWSPLRKALGREVLGKSLVVFAVGVGVHRGGRMGILGKGYRAISEAPFLRERQCTYRRILAPMLARFLQLHGRLYGLFHLVVHFFTICMTLAFLVERQATLTLFELTSLSSTEFLNFHFRVLGYPEVLVYLAVLIVFTLRVQGQALYAVLGLMLLAHEVVPIVGFLPVLLAQRRTNEFLCCVGISLGYAAIAFFFSGMPLREMVAMHTQIDQRSAINWLVSHPETFLIGLYVIYKALWFVVLQGGLLAFRDRDWALALTILFCVVLPLPLVLLGVDTSRLLSFGFVGLLFALADRLKHLSPRSRFVLFLVHLLLPSFYIGSNFGDIWLVGFYQPYRWFIRRHFSWREINILPDG